MFVRLYASKGMRLTRTFESYCDAIAFWPGMFVEPDGSFVWAIGTGKDRTQVDGMIYDRDGAIEYLELKGECDLIAWNRLCSTLMTETVSTKIDFDSRLIVHDVELGRWLTPNEFAAKIAKDE